MVFVSLIYGIVGILCLRSNYLSGAGANFGKATISVMRAELNFPLSSLPALLYPHFGIVFPVSITLLVIAVIKCRKRLEPDVLGWDWGSFFGFALCAVFFLAVGIWFWIFWTGGVNQVRYFSPFALMSVICMVPVFITTLRTLSRTSRVAFRTLSLMAAATLAFLLVQKNPPAQWQLATGLDLSTDYYHAEIEQARSFLRRLQALNRSADIYSLSPNTGYTDIVESEFIFQSFLNPSAPKVFLQRPVDWQRPSAVRVGELLDSNYVLFDVVPEPERTRLLSANQLSGVYDEIPIFSAWFTGFTEQDGVKTICETAAVRLVEITNASKLEASILRLMKNREWSETFVKANPQRWWNRSELAEAAKESPPAIQDVSFGNMFEIHALSLKKEGNNINVQVWLVPLHHDSGARWFMFFHQIDAKGAIIGNAEFVLPEEVPGKPSETFLLKTTTFNVIDPQLVKTLGIGIHDDSPIMHTLPADKGTRDWGDHRILVPMPSGS